MATDWLSRFVRPRIGSRSTYTVLGFIGYGVATALGAILSITWGLTLEERVIALVVPPVAFVLVVAVATAITGHELIVFYQTAIAGAVATAIGGAIAGASIWRLHDVAMLGTGVFLVFGRLGCFTVACCHGRPARVGVGVSCRKLDDGSCEWVMSSAHPAWSPAAAARLASALFRDHEMIEGRTPGLVHIITRD